MSVGNRIAVGAIVGLLCLPLVSALAGAVNVDATWRSSEDGFVSFAGYGYGGPRPDGHIKLTAGYVGDNIYNGTGRNQIVATTVGARGTATFTARLENDGTVTDRLRLAGPASTTAFRITYLAGATDITNQVVAGTYRTGPLAPGARTTVQVVIKAKVGTTAGATVTAALTVRSSANPSLIDVVKAKVTRA